LPHRYPPGHALREAQHAHLIATTPECQVEWAHPAARHWLKQFFPRPEHAKKLPRKICRWLAAEARSTGRQVLVVRRGDAYLFVHWQRPHARDAIALLLERVKKCGRGPQRRHGKLTTRENEVLHWLAAGKSNAEMAEILGVSSSTVGKHLERIYEKLGVENRTAAASFYQQAGRV
jgi:DNA-binding CsgD family transcriptional regulator